jgi:hypothetical protein
MPRRRTTTRNLSKLNVESLHTGESYQVIYYDDDGIAKTEILKLTQKSKYSNSDNHRLSFQNMTTGEHYAFDYNNDDLISILVPQQGGKKSRKHRLQQRKSRKLRR